MVDSMTRPDKVQN